MITPEWIECPVCGWRSHNPNDVREGYCGHCHAYTSRGWPRFFGPAQLRKDYEVLVAAPIGEACACGEAIADGDVGSINRVGEVHHYECLMRALIGSVGHLKRACSCYGGKEEDPPGLTSRQAAQAALTYWNTHQNE